MRDRSLGAGTGPVRVKAGNPQHLAAPMPAAVVVVAVGVGVMVAAGQKLLTLEAMKMETTFYAERAGRSARCRPAPGRRSRAEIC